MKYSDLSAAAGQACDAIGCQSTAVYRIVAGKFVLAGTHGCDTVALGILRAALRSGEVEPRDTSSGLAAPIDVVRLPRCGDVAAFRLEFEEELLGIMVLIWHEAPAPLKNHSVISAFASHLGIACMNVAPRRSPGRSPLPLDGLYDLVLLTEGITGFMTGLNRIVSERLPGVRVGLMLWDEETATLQMTDGSFGADLRATSSYWVSSSDLRSNSARVFLTGQPYLTNHPRDDQAVLKEYADAFGLRRLISVSLRSGNRRVGVLHIADGLSHFGTEHLATVESFAPQVASAVELARANYALRREQRVEGDLGRLAVSIATGTYIRDALQQTLDALCVVTDTVVLALVPVGTPPIVGRQPNIDAEIESALLRRASAEPAESNQVEGTPRAGEPGSSWLFLPVQLEQERVGTLCTVRLKAQPFSSDERATLLRLGGLITLGWAAERYQQQRAELAKLHERARIADELHDNVAQLLFAGQIHLDSMLTGQLSPDDREQLARQTSAVLSRAEGAIREVIHQLEPARRDAFLDWLCRVVEDVERDFGVAIHLDVEGLKPSVLAEAGATTIEFLMAAARECLVNAVKHNVRPCRVSLSAQSVGTDRVRLTVIDDGAGLHTNTANGGGHGLVAMRRKIAQRGGTVRIRSVPSGGSQVTISVAV